MTQVDSAARQVSQDSANHGAQQPTTTTTAQRQMAPLQQPQEQQLQQLHHQQQQIPSGLPPLITPSTTPLHHHPAGYFPPRTPQSVPLEPTTPTLSHFDGATSTTTAMTPSISTSTSTTHAPPAPLPTVECLVRARIPMKMGTEVWLHIYSNNVDSKEHLALVFGPHISSRSLNEPRPGETEMDRMVRGAYTGRLYPGRTASGLLLLGDSGSPTHATTADASASTLEPPLVRIHSECYTGETAWSARCDCGEQLDEAAHLMCRLPEMTSRGGVIVYLRQEGRGIGLVEKLKAYNLQDLGNDTVEANLLLRHPADARSYGLATAILQDLGLSEIRLLTNNPDKARAVEGPGREVVVRERVAMVPRAWRGEEDGIKGTEFNGYLRTKIEKMGHMLDLGAMPLTR